MEPQLDVAMVLTGIAWAAILGMLAWGAVTALWRWLRPPRRAPFFGMLERHGLSLARVEQAGGFARLREAAARCSSCAAAAACRRALRWPWLGFKASSCPNNAFFARFADERLS